MLEWGKLPFCNGPYCRKIHVLRLESFLGGRPYGIWSDALQSVLKLILDGRVAKAQNMLSQPDHVVFSVFQMKLQLADEVITCLMNLLRGWRFLAEFLKNLLYQLQASGDVGGFDARSDRHQAGIIEEPQGTVYRIGEPVVLTLSLIHI